MLLFVIIFKFNVELNVFRYWKDALFGIKLCRTVGEFTSPFWWQHFFRFKTRGYASAMSDLDKHAGLTDILNYKSSPFNTWKCFEALISLQRAHYNCLLSFLFKRFFATPLKFLQKINWDQIDFIKCCLWRISHIKMKWSTAWN